MCADIVLTVPTLASMLAALDTDAEVPGEEMALGAASAIRKGLKLWKTQSAPSPLFDNICTDNL